MTAAPLLIPKEMPELTAAVEETTAQRLEENTARYQIWSTDGVWSAALTNISMEFSVRWQKPGEGFRGGVYDLQNWDGLETSVTGISHRPSYFFGASGTFSQRSCNTSLTTN